jgi:DNA-binding XRE family transcriptional regulator
MTDKSKKASQAAADRAKTLKDVRATLGRTQAELADALGLSVKAVQSYEQGWRDVPVRVMIQLVVLLALYRKHSMDDIPCWETRHCEEDMRSSCAAFTIGKGQFCWFVGRKDCRPTAGSGPENALPCMTCPVVQRLLRGPSETVNE